MKLYHFTCEVHGLRALGEGKATLSPGEDGMVWMTDLGFPVKRILGMPNEMHGSGTWEDPFTLCDRTAARYEVDEEELHKIFPWAEVRKKLSFEAIASVELVEGISVLHWYASSTPIAVHYSPLRG